MTVRRKIAVVLVDRANYGRMKPVMAAIASTPQLEMQVICAGTMVLERFGQATKIVRRDGFTIDSEVFIELEGSNPITMAKSLGFAVIEFSSEFARLKPDIVLVIGDRYEAFAATIAASYLNLCIAHIQGGEVSGSIDESARHCMTKLAHYHFPATTRARDYIVRMGEDPNTVFNVGCPSGDSALKLAGPPEKELFEKGIGGTIDPKSYLLVVFHPVTTEFGLENDETANLIQAVAELGKTVLWLWPNIDAGSDHVSKVIRAYREANDTHWLRLVKNYSPEDYHRVLANATCAIGNSSSFVRDSTFFGTPVVLVGDRQRGRETGPNLVAVPPVKDKIVEAAKKQIEHGRFHVSDLYGKGDSAPQIVASLLALEPYVQKNLHFASES